MNIPEFNKIDVNNDTKDVIQAKIDKMIEYVESGVISQDEFDNEKNRVESEIGTKKLGYSFTWLKSN